MDQETLRRYVYAILMTVTAGLMTARIVGVEFVYEPSLYKSYPDRKWPTAKPDTFPTFSSNDRSRWAAVRALVENESFIVGKRVADPTATFTDKDGGSRIVDGVRIKDLNAKNGYYDEGIAFQEGYKSVDYVKNPETNAFYSSKPPLFTVFVAAEYWLLKRGLGWTLTDAQFRWPVVCAILITFNVLPMLIFLLLLANLIEEYGTTDWGRLFVFTAACFGTFLTTFAVTLNNHTPAAFCVMAAIYPLLRGRGNESNRPFTIVELLIAGFFSGLALCCDLPAAAFTAAVGFIILIRSPSKLVWFIPAALIPIAALMATNFMALGEWQLAYDKFGGPWYEYEGSHWSKAKLNPDQKGIDFAREAKWKYTLHMMVGHHGLFSLTPIWLFSLIGMLGLGRGKTPAIQALNVLGLLVTMVVIAFYVWKTNNYGGWTSGPRWQFWLTPIFLMTMLPVVDRLARSGSGRKLGYLFLAIAAFSAAYPVWNPWRHPWPYQLCEYMNWLKY
ncbi:MAG: hypothetical protein K8T89_02920 [Planctomycetes bacterium]|nr:hypothetical protein [Planctomycetota bacterium]